MNDENLAAKLDAMAQIFTEFAESYPTADRATQIRQRMVVQAIRSDLNRELDKRKGQK